MKIIKKLQASKLAVTRGDRPVFQNLGFGLIQGKILKLVGPNGSGKSTLLKALSGLLETNEGDILADDVSILGHTEWLSDNICYLGHKNALKREFTVLENVKFWAKLNGKEDQVTNALRQMGIEYLEDTPARYLSSGQARRAALARALCQNAAIWLFDEPTVGLDEEGLNLLAKAMTSHLNAGGMILCATHVDLGIAEEKIMELNLADYTVSLSPEWEIW